VPSQEVFKFALDCTTIVTAIVIIGYLIFGKHLTVKGERSTDPPFASTSFLMITAGIVVVVATTVVIFAGNPRVTVNFNSLINTSGWIGVVCYILNKIARRLDSTGTRPVLSLAVTTGLYLYIVGGGVGLGLSFIAPPA
jgi:FtsH-binding integral membrane protein